jgi:hypothetical protein
MSDNVKTGEEKVQDAIHLLKMVSSGERFGILTDEARTVLEALEYQQQRLDLAARVIKNRNDREWEQVGG